MLRRQKLPSLWVASPASKSDIREGQEGEWGGGRKAIKWGETRAGSLGLMAENRSGHLDLPGSRHPADQH